MKQRMKYREKLVRLVFIVKVASILGFEKTLVLLKEAEAAFPKEEKNNKEVKNER